MKMTLDEMLQQLKIIKAERAREKAAIRQVELQKWVEEEFPGQKRTN